jgi:hypothetical protein
VGPDRSALVVSNDGSDYAVVLQYSDKPLRIIETEGRYHAVTANIFFSGWIIDPERSDVRETPITIQAVDSQLIVGLTFLSIASTYIILFFAVFIAPRKALLAASRLLNRLKHDVM